MIFFYPLQAARRLQLPQMGEQEMLRLEVQQGGRGGGAPAQRLLLRNHPSASPLTHWRYWHSKRPGPGGKWMWWFTYFQTRTVNLRCDASEISKKFFKVTIFQGKSIFCSTIFGLSIVKLQHPPFKNLWTYSESYSSGFPSSSVLMFGNWLKCEKFQNITSELGTNVGFY